MHRYDVQSPSCPQMKCPHCAFDQWKSICCCQPEKPENQTPIHLAMVHWAPSQVPVGAFAKGAFKNRGFIFPMILTKSMTPPTLDHHIPFRTPLPLWALGPCWILRLCTKIVKLKQHETAVWILGVENQCSKHTETLKKSEKQWLQQT